MISTCGGYAAVAGWNPPYPYVCSAPLGVVRTRNEAVRVVSVAEEIAALSEAGSDPQRIDRLVVNEGPPVTAEPAPASCKSTAFAPTPSTTDQSYGRSPRAPRG
jgi:hypothetical protein